MFDLSNVSIEEFSQLSLEELREQTQYLEALIGDELVIGEQLCDFKIECRPLSLRRELELYRQNKPIHYHTWLTTELESAINPLNKIEMVQW